MSMRTKASASEKWWVLLSLLRLWENVPRGCCALGEADELIGQKAFLHRPLHWEEESFDVCQIPQWLGSLFPHKLKIRSPFTFFSSSLSFCPITHYSFQHLSIQHTTPYPCGYQEEFVSNLEAKGILGLLFAMSKSSYIEPHNLFNGSYRLQSLGNLN